jgi:hypothetical protein
MSGMLHSPLMELRGMNERIWAAALQSIVVLGVALLFSLLVQPAHSAARPDNGDRSLVVEFFYFDSRARKVSVVGSFNQWSPDAHLMEKNGDRWSVEVQLPPGRYEYAFLIDDRVWKADPSSLVKEKSGFGASNSILIVE